MTKAEGGIAQGIGYALTESFIEDGGVSQNVTLATYIVPTSKDVPDIQSIILESYSGKGPFGAKELANPLLGQRHLRC